MWPYRSDRAVRILTILITVAYFGTWAASTVVLLGAPAIKFMARETDSWIFGLPIEVEMRDSEAALGTRWGDARIAVEDVRGTLRLPIPTMSWTLFGVLWTYMAMTFGLTLLFLHHLRRVLHRAREGAPFDPDNAGRLRLLGLLAFALALLQGTAGFLTSLAVNQGFADSGMRVPTGIHLNEMLVLFGLVLLTLAEVFRRGAELEREQSLVV